MKKILLSLLISSSFAAYSQETNMRDALRYSIDNLNGTARFRSMGGAFGAIGGDMSAINVNPAGSSIFNFNQATLSLSSFNKSNSTSYFGTSSKSNENSLDINQFGAVFVFNDNQSKSGWKKFALGLNYENANNFDDFIVSEGVNPFNSMDSYFLRFANARPGNIAGSNYQNLDFIDQQALLGYESYMIDYNATGDNYFSNVPTGGNYFHRNTIQSNGYNGKFTLNFSGAYEDKLYLGMNMNFHFTDYVRTSSLYESNQNNFFNSGYSIDTARFNNELYTYGSGFSMNLGAIYKANKNIRLGLAYETPTWYRLNDELTQSISSNVYDAALNTMIQSNFDPNVLNIYPTYRIQTPSKLTSSATVLFGKKGLLSVDYISKNYAKTEFRPNNEVVFGNLNNQIRNELQDNYELRVGGEYKIKQWSLRGGYRFEKSPFIASTTFGDLISYSSGLGYNFGNSRLDIAYTNERRDRTESLLTSGLNDLAFIRNNNNNVTLSYIVNF